MGLKDLARNSPRGGRYEVMRSFGEVATVGLSFVFAIMIGAVGGYYLDQKFGWTPYGFFIGFGFGLAAGVRNVFLVTRKYLK